MSKYTLEQIQEAVSKIVSEQLNVRITDVAPDSTLENLGGDSLDLVEIVMAVEDEFKIPDIPDEEAESVKTIQDLINAACRHVPMKVEHQPDWRIQLHDEAAVEKLFWEFDAARNASPGEERLRFKETVRNFVVEQIKLDRQGKHHATDLNEKSATYGQIKPGVVR